MLSLVWWHMSLHMRVLAVYLIGLLLLASRETPHWLTGVIVIHFQSSAKVLYVTLWMSLASLRAILYWVLLSEWLLFYVLTLCSTPYLWAHGALRYRHKQRDEALNIYFLYWVLFSHDTLHVHVLKNDSNRGEKILLGSEHVSLCHVFIDTFPATNYMQISVLP